MLAMASVRPLCASTARPCRAPRSACRMVIRAQQQQPAGVVSHITRTVEAVKPAAITVAANILVAMPALANEEPGKLFDFGLTLPFMAAQFLLLMVFLDKTWFGPVGRHLDERDAQIREKLASFREGTTEVADLIEKAEAAVREARAEAQQTILKAKAEAQAESAKKLDAVKQKVDAELKAALAELEKEKQTAIASLDSQVEKMGEEILARILPEGVKI